MKANINKSHGFAPAVVLIIILIVTAIAGAGWYVMNRQKSAGGVSDNIELTISASKSTVKAGEDLSVKVTAHNNSSKEHLEAFSNLCTEPSVLVNGQPSKVSQPCLQAVTAVAIPAKDSISWDETVTGDRLQKGTNSLTARWGSSKNEYASNTVTVEVAD